MINLESTLFKSYNVTFLHALMDEKIKISIFLATKKWQHKGMYINKKNNQYTWQQSRLRYLIIFFPASLINIGIKKRISLTLDSLSLSFVSLSLCLSHFSFISVSHLSQGARCSSVVRAFVHGAMGRRIDPSWGGPIEIFLIPASAPQLV